MPTRISAALICAAGAASFFGLLHLGCDLGCEVGALCQELCTDIATLSSETILMSVILAFLGAYASIVFLSPGQVIISTWRVVTKLISKKTAEVWKDKITYLIPTKLVLMIIISRVAVWAVWRDMGGASQGTSAHPFQAQAPGLKCFFIKYPNQYVEKVIRIFFPTDQVR